MEKQSKKERNNNYVNCIIYDHDAYSIWKDIWICAESNLGDHKNYFFYCVASSVFSSVGIYGVDVDRISGSDLDRIDLILFM